MNTDKTKEALKKLKEQDSFSDGYNCDHRMLDVIESLISDIEESSKKKCVNCYFRYDCDYATSDSDGPLWDCNGYQGNTHDR